MSDTIFLIQRNLPDDTTKKSNAVASPDTVRKDLHVASKDIVVKKTKTDTEKTAKAEKPRNADNQRVVTQEARTEAATQPVAEPTVAATMSADTQAVPLYPPYIYHIDDTVQYEQIQLFDIDSLLTANDSVFYHRSIFKGHTYEPKSNVTPQRPSADVPMWVFLAIVLVACLLGRVVSRYKGSKSDILLSPFLRFGLKNLLNERTMNNPAVNLLVDFLYSVLLTLSEFFVIRHFGVTITGTPALDFLLLEGITFVFIYARIMLVKFIGSVFNYKISTSAYVLNQSICNLLCGMLLVPALLLAFYSSLNSTALLYVLTVIIVVMFLVRVVRGSLLMLSESQFSKIYMLYYMFVIEIVPILVIGKWITLQM